MINTCGNVTCNFPTFVFLLLDEASGDVCSGKSDPFRGDDEDGWGAY